MAREAPWLGPLREEGGREEEGVEAGGGLGIGGSANLEERETNPPYTRGGRQREEGPNELCSCSFT